MITWILLNIFSPSSRFARAAKVILCFAAVAAASGCAERKARAFPWAAVVMVRPNPPVARVDATAATDLAPDIRIDPPANNGKILNARPVPVRPRINAAGQPEGVDAAKTTALVPELGPQETAVAKQQVVDSIAIAERNLTAARGRKLSPTQSDIVSKINSFVAEAREASGAGDWARARNLAKKAQILSEDLVASL